MSRSSVVLDLSVYLVTDAASAASAGHDVIDVVRGAAAGGVTTVQLREKHAPARIFLETVIAVAAELPEHVTLLVNDRVDVYLAAKAAGARVGGVHLGQSDLPAALVRRLVGAEAVIGVSGSTPAELRAINTDHAAGVDYIGVGALHPTTTKADAPEPLGLEGFAALVPESRLPLVAIGGITTADIPGLRSASAAGAAVVSAICAAADPGLATAEFASLWKEQS